MMLKIYILIFDCTEKFLLWELIQAYLYPEVFPNMQLKVLGEDRTESIIINKEKEDLIIFTASWCQPCHKLIPVLKELYAELKDKLVFTYISIDDSKTVENWPRVIQENQLPGGA
jgi:thiol-disulfide isomerase/thioredoxin